MTDKYDVTSLTHASHPEKAEYHDYIFVKMFDGEQYSEPKA